MIPPYFFRSTVFNLCFYILTGICCIILLPTLVLPRKYYMGVVYGFGYTTAFLEKYILRLSYEIRGKEHLPDGGAYIVAAKHQSAYETFKLHILFNDPAVVLKKELLKIPLWGKYLEKSDVIAIDRSTPKIAIKSIQDGAQRVKNQGRSIIIFPQGTRVKPETTAKERPYKIGIMRIQESTNLPIIPMALNTGIFYPKGGWCKKPGKVIFEFLPPVQPDHGKDVGSVLKQLETDIEQKSGKIMNEARESLKNRKPRGVIYSLVAILACCIAYSAYWFSIANVVNQSVLDALADIRQNPNIKSYEGKPPRVYGFPGKLKLHLPQQHVQTARESIIMQSVDAESWPFPAMPATFTTGNISIKLPHWKGDLVFDSIDGIATLWADVLTLEEITLKQQGTEGLLSGTVELTEPYPIIDLDIAIKNHQPFLFTLVAKKIIKEKPAALAAMALQAMQRDGVVKSKVATQGNKLYLGPIRIYEFPNPQNALTLQDGTQSGYATKRVKPVLDR